MATKPADLIYGVDDMPPIGRLIPLGLQFVIYISVTLVYIVLISEYGNVPPKVTADSISMAMIAIGIATILQSLWKGPVGSGYFASPVYSAVYLAPCVLAVKAGGLPAVFAMTIFQLLSATASPISASLEGTCSKSALRAKSRSR